MYVFVYGSLKYGLHNYMIMREAEGKIENEGLTYPKKKFDGSYVSYELISLGSFPAIIPSTKNICVSGEIYRVPVNKIEILDRLEGHPTFYVRKVESIYVGDYYIDCSFYVLNTTHIPTTINKKGVVTRGDVETWDPNNPEAYKG